MKNSRVSSEMVEEFSQEHEFKKDAGFWETPMIEAKR